MQATLLDRIRFLRAVPLFEGLSDDVLRLVANYSTQRTFQAGEILVYQGDVGSTCYVITQGRVRVFVVAEDGRELAVRILGPGEIFGEMALLDDEPRSANVDKMRCVVLMGYPARSDNSEREKPSSA